MEPIEILRAARKLIEDPKAWTKGAPARDAERREVYPGGADAVCFCAVGAVEHISPQRHDFAVTDALARSIPNRPKGVLEFYGIASFNDHPDTTHADVLALFDRAIASLEE